MNPTQPQPRHWAVVPAAGIGRRMGGTIPKQYLELAGRTVLEHTLWRLVAHTGIAGIVVSHAEDDPRWPPLADRLPESVLAVAGGAERCHSVLNALRRLEGIAVDSDWVLVHDAARPCLRAEDISRLMETLADDPVGGLLGLPVSDTVKRAAADGRVLETVPRDGLWRALTPQMFRLGTLREALAGAVASGVLVTDEAAAMERAGHAPRMVEGHADNIKITRPEDLPLARMYLAQQEGEA